ncbi:MAG: HDOD domain-containing protein [Rhodocyclaceae bacterium]|nr:HDOD domain-containing protein [Rhodocyclaceae bacterium]
MNQTGNGRTVEPQAWGEFVRELAIDLSRGKVVFPTSFDTTIRLREVLRSERTGAIELVRIIAADPLLSTRVVQAANSVAYARLGPRVSDIKSAVVRIGSNQVKTLATAVAMAQLVTYRRMLPFKSICHKVIEHSRQVAAYAFVLARQHTRLDGDKALFAGLIHDMGTLYLLFRLSERPDLFGDAVGLRKLLIEWRGQIGHSVMAALDVTPEIQEAIVGFDQMDESSGANSLADVLFIADTLVELDGPNVEPVRAVDPKLRAERIAGIDEFRQTIAAESESVKELMRAVG